MESVSHFISALIGIALISSVAEAFVHEAAMRQVLRVIMTTALAAVLLSFICDLDFYSYASAVRDNSVFRSWDSAAAQEQTQRMDRIYIESECAAYVESRGKTLGIPLRSVQITLRWNTDGYWVPDHAVILVEHMTDACDQLQDVITADLGIPPESQEWSCVKDET